MAGEIVASEDRNWWKWRRDELTGAICIINPAGTEYEISASRLAQLDRDVATLLNDMLEGLIDLQNENEALRARDALRDRAEGQAAFDVVAQLEAEKAARAADKAGFEVMIRELRAEVAELMPYQLGKAKQIEQEIQAKGLTAPRITPADVEAQIVAEYFFTAAHGVLGASTRGELVVRNPAEVSRSGAEMLTFCVLQLRNGTRIVGTNYSAIDPAQHSAERGRADARAQAVEQIWSLMGYERTDRRGRGNASREMLLIHELDGKPMNVDKIMTLCWLRGGSKDLERLASLIAIQNANIAESPKRCMEMMSQRSVELQMVLEEVEVALNGLDEMLSDDPGQIRFPTIEEIEMGRNIKARRILRDWHRSSDRHAPVPLSPPSAEQ